MIDDSGSYGEERLKDDAEGIEEVAVPLLTGIHAAITNFHLYPPTSDMVTNSVGKAYELLTVFLENNESLTMSEVEGKLVMNGVRLDEREQARTNIRGFCRMLNHWDIKSLTFKRGLTKEEMAKFLDIFHKDPSKESKRIGEIISDNEIAGISVDERIYVTLDSSQKVVDGKVAEVAEAAEKAGVSERLKKDDQFMQFLLGRMSMGEVGDARVGQVLQSAEQLNTVTNDIIKKIDEETVPKERLSMIRETVDRLFGLTEIFQDADTRTKVRRELERIMLALNPDEIAEVISSDVPEALKEGDLKSAILEKSSDKASIAKSLARRYSELRSEEETQENERKIIEIYDTVADLYLKAKPDVQVEITAALEESKIVDDMEAGHLDKFEIIESAVVMSRIKTTGTLKPLGGRSDDVVADVVARLLNSDEKEISFKIINNIANNLDSEEPEFRKKSVTYFYVLYKKLKPSNKGNLISDKYEDFLEMFKEESNPEVLNSFSSLFVMLLTDLFSDNKWSDFYKMANELIVMVDNGNGARADIAKRTLQKLNIRDVGRPLILLLNSDLESTRNIAMRLLMFMDSEAVVRSILLLVKDDTDFQIGDSVKKVFASSGDIAVNAAREECAADNSEDAIEKIMLLLEALDRSSAASIVQDLVSHPIPSVRARAYALTGALSDGDERALQALEKGISDSDTDARRAAVRALGTIRAPRSTQLLISVLQGGSKGKEESPKVEEAACLALAKLGNREAVPYLVDILKKKRVSVKKKEVSPLVKAAAAYALAELGAKEGVALVKEMTNDSDTMLRNQARKALSVYMKKGMV